MEAYFSGLPPFSKPKSREDIPDSFIYESLKTISDDSGKIYFVCADNNLRKSCDNIQNIKGLKSFSELFDLPEFKTIINEKYKAIEHYADELLILKTNITNLKEKVNDLDLLTALEGSMISSPYILDDSNVGRIVDINNVDVIDIDETKTQYIDNYFYIPINAKAKFTIEHYMFKSDYPIYSKSRKIHIMDSDWSKNFYFVEETFKVNFSFKYKIAKDNVKLLNDLKIVDISFNEVNIII